MSKNAKLRRYENDLNISGIGVILMGVWSLLKIIFETILNSEEFFDVNGLSDHTYGIIIMVLFIIIIFFVIMTVHLYIGMNAIKAAKGRKHKKNYFIAAVIILLLTILSIIDYKNKFEDLEHFDTTLSALLVDLTTIYIFIVLIRSSIKIKQIKKVYDIGTEQIQKY